MKFSERILGVRRALQKESMDDALKNSLWNVMYQGLWEPHDGRGKRALGVTQGTLLLSIWTELFNEPADDAGGLFSRLLRQIRERYMGSDWRAVYDFIEFVASSLRFKGDTDQLTARFNAALEKHLSAYRFVGTILAPITSEEEITAVEQAMSHGGQFKPVVAHLETALARLADRASPDYRNSIKESISPVEAVCQFITGDPKATLGQALRRSVYIRP